MVNSAMGTLSWCEESGGSLSPKEKEILAHYTAKLQAEILFDEFRSRLGLLKPKAVDIDTLAPPKTALTRDADEFARGIYNNDGLWNHCVRTYYFGALVAAHDEIKFDREIFYAAAVCHDLGVIQERAGPVASCCFAHSGGRLARDHLVGKGHSGEAAQRVGDAISTHLNLIVPLGEYPAESTLTAVGATCDIFGAYVRRIDRGTLARVVERWPRTGLMDILGPFLHIAHLKDSRLSVHVEMGAFGNGAAQHPIEALLADH